MLGFASQAARLSGGSVVGHFRIVASCLFALVVSGCATNPIGPALSRDDPFSPYREVISSAVRPPAFPDNIAYRLIGRRDRKTGVVTTLADVLVMYTGEIQVKYEVARNIRAETLPITVVMRTSSGCMKKPCQYTEHVRIEIAEGELRTAAGNGGYAFKLFARAGNEHIIQVPHDLIQSLFASMDAPSTPHRTATAPEGRS